MASCFYGFLIGKPADVPPEAKQRALVPSVILTTLILDKWDEIG
jgi:hypothetical protein